uniref:Uncharacterized protein n=1 Tax=Meloidogyne incognita TaxID=6306 RepID=A0A914LD42_MELIC
MPSQWRARSIYKTAYGPSKNRPTARRRSPTMTTNQNTNGAPKATKAPMGVKYTIFLSVCLSDVRVCLSESVRLLSVRVCLSESVRLLSVRVCLSDVRPSFVRPCLSVQVRPSFVRPCLSVRVRVCLSESVRYVFNLSDHDLLLLCRHKKKTGDP